MTTYAVVSGTPYPIDTGTFTNLFTPLAVTTSGSTVTPDSFVACNSGTSYTISMVTSKQVPSGGIIKVIVPTQVYLSQASLTGCEVTAGGST